MTPTPSPAADEGASRLAVAIVDPDARVRAVSSAFASTLRIRRDELLGQLLTVIVRQEDRSSLGNALRKVAAGDWPGCTVEVHVPQHGREERAIRFLLESDGAQRVRLTAIDLSSEREAMATMRAYEESLRALTQHSLDIWALVSDTGVVKSMSDSVSVHLGWQATDLEGRELMSILAPEAGDRFTELLRDLKNDPSAVRSVVLQAQHREGSVRTLESTVSGFNPAILGNSVFVLNARDVTARERTEAALREVEYRFSRLVEQALTGIAVVQEGRLVYANPRFLDLTGLTPESLAQRPRALSLVDRKSVRALRDVRAELATGSSQASRIQLRARRSDGATVDVDVATSVVDFHGKSALLCTVTDMTDARALQRRMAEAEKVEAVGLLAGGVAHDFNNMLTGILAWVDIAHDDVDPTGPVATALAEIRSSAERAAELTRQLLAFGRRQLLDPRPLDLGEVVVRLKRWMDRALGADHYLVLAVPDTTWLVQADRSQLERALTALIMNAVDAMPNGGEIHVTVAHESFTRDRAERVGPLTAGDHVVVTVADRGVGMDEATKRRIFEPFFTTKTQGRGTGLGLAAVQGTVLQSGGAIEVETAPGAGTAFRLVFPRLNSASEAPAGPIRQALAPKRVARSILVVEDDPELGKVLRRLLAGGGHSVRLAASAAEAELLAHAERVDVVVCDIGLPGRNGADLAGALRAGNAARASILISGRPITDEERAMAGAPSIALHKPFRPQHLLDAVDEIIRVAAP